MLVKPRLQKCICSHYTGYYYVPTQKPYYRASVRRYKGCFWSDFGNGVKLHSVDLGMMLDVSEQVAQVLLLFIPYQTA